jgi:hypothetical protein
VFYCTSCGVGNTDGAAFCSSCGRSLKASESSTDSSPSSQEFSFGPIPAGVASFHISSAFSNAVNLLKSPGTFMRQNKDSTVSVNSIMINYVAVLAVIPLVATLIGDLWFYRGFFFSYAIGLAITTYVLDIVAVFVMGIIIWKLAPSFGSQTDQAKSTLLASFVFTPVFLISILNIIPFIGWIAFLGLLYGLYILYLGLPIMLGAPANRSLTYTIVTVVAAIIVYAIIDAITVGVSTALILRSLFQL